MKKYFILIIPLFFEKSRIDKQIIPNREEWESLQFGKFGKFANDSSWKWRRQSLSITEKILKIEKQN